MGFTTGFLGGVTLTYSLLYISLHIHRANRHVQKTLLSQQSYLLNTIVEPPTPLPDPPAYEVRKAGLTEELKDRWNREVEKLVRNVQETDWSRKREVYEQRIAGVWGRVRASESGKQVEKKAEELGQRVGEKAKELEQKVKETVSGAADEANEKVKEAGREKRLLELQ